MVLWIGSSGIWVDSCDHPLYSIVSAGDVYNLGGAERANADPYLLLLSKLSEKASLTEGMAAFRKAGQLSVETCITNMKYT